MKNLVQHLTESLEEVNENMNDSEVKIAFERVKNALPELEKLITKYTNVNVKLVAEINTRRRIIDVYSKNMIDSLKNTIAYSSFKEIAITFLGGEQTSDGSIYFRPQIKYSFRDDFGQTSTELIWKELFLNTDGKWIEGKKA